MVGGWDELQIPWEQWEHSSSQRRKVGGAEEFVGGAEQPWNLC